MVKKITKKLKKGEVENVGFRRCQQIQCSYYTQGGCKPCADCKSKPYEIKKDCKRCFACENVPGAIRWGDKNNKITITKRDLITKMVEQAVMINEVRQKPIVIGGVNDE